MVTRPDGTTYILDKDSAKIRKLTPDGNISTLATLTEKIESGRGLWVSPDESKAYVSSKERLLGWSAKDGTTVVATGFSSLANLAVAPDGTIFATDRGAHLVLQIAADGKVTTIAGNGDTQGGKSGDLGTKIGLAGARGLARAKDGSLWVGTQEARTIWWISPDLHAYKIIDGLTGKAAILTEPESPAQTNREPIFLSTSRSIASAYSLAPWALLWKPCG